MRRSLAIAFLLCGLIAPASARAEATGPYSAFHLASFGSVGEGFGVQQFERAEEAAASGDGRYVAMVGSIGGTRGIWRRTLGGSEVARVAPANAVLPSISEDGRYVAFTTNEPLIPGEDSNGAPDVYVRDMSKPFAESCTSHLVEIGECPYRLASTPSGKSEALHYEGASERYGSLAAGRTAISADGRYVAFETTATSNLVGAATPPLQVAVHDMQGGTTELVSAEIEPKSGKPVTVEVEGHQRDVPVPIQTEGSEGIGAVFPGGDNTPTFPPKPNATFGASISADGSTVAWLGQDISQQARALEDEQFEPKATEPLWRRLHSPASPIRRITGGSDPEAPACIASGEKSLRADTSLEDPCQGPFEATSNEGIFTLSQTETDGLPRLSADGMTVVFLASNERTFLPGGSPFKGAAASATDAYLVDMHPGLTRVQAITRLTEPGSLDTAAPLLIDSIRDLAISPGGGKVAFVTRRGVFPLASLSLLTAQLSVAGENELYVVDLEKKTLARVTHGFGGEEEPTSQEHEEAQSGVDPYEEGQGAFSPSFSASGEVLAFTSSASNIVYGDGNQQSDSFVALQSGFTPNPPEQQISQPPENPVVQAPWRLSAVASAAGAGARVDAALPGPGLLEATLSTRVVDGRQVRATVLGRAQLAVGAAGLQSLTIDTTAALARLISSRGQAASVTVRFSAAGHATLEAAAEVTIHGSYKQQARRRVHRHARRRGRR